MDTIAAIIEWLLHPLLQSLDRSGILGKARFGPLSRVAAAIAAVIIVSYILSLLTKPVSDGTARLRKVRFLGRIVTIGIAIMMTRNILDETGFIVGRQGAGNRIMSSNLGYFLVLGLVIFLEIRLMRKK